MVPSWTETLVAAGFPVVGRTRFCIHPKVVAETLPAVGGTKDISWEKIAALKATHVILDRDENPLAFYDQALTQGLIPVVTHVRGLESASQGLDFIADAFPNLAGSRQLRNWAREYRNFLAVPPLPLKLDRVGFTQYWFQKPTTEIKTVLYIIWKSPWMGVARDTFIGDMLATQGVEIPVFENPYPELDLNLYLPAETLLLLSSEPYPFATKGFDDAELLPFPRALIDGEHFSWFGLRALEYLRLTRA